MVRKRGQSAGVGAKKARGAAAPNRFDAGKGRQLRAGEEKRRQILLPALRREGKAGRVVDRRLGEHSGGLSREERQTRRLAWAKRKELAKARKFHLPDQDDDEDAQLTHFGQSLASVQKYEKPLGSDDEEDRHGISSDFVAAAHFGGGGEEEMDANGKPLSRKEMISLAIAKSKQAKVEKSREKEAGTEATDELDSRLRSESLQAALRSLMGKKEEEKKASSDYDRLFRTLGLDSGPRGSAAPRLPTPLEAAQKAAEMAGEQEQARLARMGNGAVEEKAEVRRGTATGVTVIIPPRSAFLSADEDPIDALPRLPMEAEQTEEFELQYDKDGKPLKKEPKKKKERKIVTWKDMAEESGAGSSQTVPEPNANKIKMPQNYTEFKAVSDEYGHEKMGDLLRELEKAYHPSLQPGNKDKLKGLCSLCVRHYDALGFRLPSEPTAITALKTLSLFIRSFAAKEPNFIAKTLQGVIEKHRAHSSSVPGLNFLLLLRLIRLVFPASDFRHPVTIPFLHLAFQRLLQVPVEKHRAHSSSVPGLNFLLLLRLIRLVFPASDFRHPVTTPFLHLAFQRLLQVEVKGTQSLCKGLALVAELVPYLRESQRYSPEVAVFLLSALRTKPLLPNFPKRRLQGQANKINIPALWLKGSEKPSWSSSVLSAVELSIEVLQIWRNLSSFPELASWFKEAVEDLVEDEGAVGDAARRLVSDATSGTEGHHLGLSQRKRGSTETNLNPPQPKLKSGLVRVLEPAMESDFRPERKRALTERQILRKQVRTEKRGTIRELRRDAELIAQALAEEERAKDGARKATTKRLMASLQGQEAEYQRHQRTKSFKR